MSGGGSASMRKCASGFKVFILALALAAVPAYSGNPAGAPSTADRAPGFARESTSAAQARPLTIAGVSVNVDGVPGGQDFENLISIAAGEAYSPKKIDAAIKQVYQTGLFSDVRVLKEGESEVRLTFLLTRRLLTRNLTIAGDKVLSRKKLTDNLYALRQDGVFTEDKLMRAAAELKEVLKKEGYLSSVIQAHYEKDPIQPLVDVIFDVSAGRRQIIRGIDIDGDAAVQVSAVKAKLESREGRPFVPSTLEADIGRLKEYYAILGYPRAEIDLESQTLHEEDGTITLVLKVVPHERIRIQIKGAKIPDALVRPIWEERVFEEWGLLQSESRILTFLRNQGYVFATVRSSIEKDAGEIRIVHDVNSGRKYTIYEIDFEGLHFFTPAAIKRELGLGLNLPLFGGIAGGRLFEMPALIEKLYEARGFPETQVDLNFKMIGNEMRAIYRVEEGFQQTIGRLSFDGASLFDAAALRQAVVSVEGRPFFRPDLQKDIERLETFYLNQGVRGTIVTIAAEPTEARQYSVVFRIAEGRRVRIERIVLTGNKVTRRSTIERELKIRQGDWAYADRILETRRSLEKLGIFAEVKIEEIPIAEDVVNLVINLREGVRNYISLGAGLETKTEPQSFEIWANGLRPRGTADFILGNMFGRASQLSFVTQFSLMETRAVVSWENRYLFGLPLQTAANAWLEREERVSYGYDQRGVSFSAIKPFGRDWVSFSTLRWASTTLYFLDVAESQVDRQHFPFSVTSVSESLILDRRDDSFNPERGYFFSVVAEWAYPLFKSESDFLKAFFKYQRFIPVAGGLNFSATARVGLGRGNIPIHERFFGGGSSSFRGEPYDELGPKDAVSQKPVGGKALVLLNFELRFPLFPAMSHLSGAVFYDKGNIFAARKDFNLGKLEDALGFGVRYRTPLGPLRIDLGWSLNPPAGRNQPIIFITIGNVF